MLIDSGRAIRIPEPGPPKLFYGGTIGHPQTCVYPDVCLGIAHVSGKVPLPGQGICPFRPKQSVGRKGQIHCVSARPLLPGEGLYQIHGQSPNTHRGKHRLGVPKTITGTNDFANAGTNYFAHFSMKIPMDQEAPKNILNMFQPVPVRGFHFPIYWHSL